LRHHLRFGDPNKFVPLRLTIEELMAIQPKRFGWALLIGFTLGLLPYIAEMLFPLREHPNRYGL